jgi:hypothetical protein
MNKESSWACPEECQYVSKIEYPDRHIDEYNKELEEIDMSYMKNYEGERIEVYSNDKIVVSGTLSVYEDEFDDIDSGGIEIEVDKNN